MKGRRKCLYRPHYAIAFLGALAVWGLLPLARGPAYAGAAQLADIPPAGTTPSASLAASLPRAATNHTESHGVETPGPHWSDAPETDVVAEPFPVIAAQFDALTAGATLTLPDPNGGEVLLHVDAVRVQGANKHLRLSHAGLASSVTLSPRQFFATVATPDGVYALSGDGHGARLIRHAELDQRSLHESDYRAARL